MVDWSSEVIHQLQDGGVGVIPTDTVYGLACSVWRPQAVERIYTLKERNPAKPLVILIADSHDLSRLIGNLTPTQQEARDRYWPGPVSLILPCPSEDLYYLHRGAYSLACRLPENEALRAMLRKTGPLATSSANKEGQPHARNSEEAKAYFGSSVDFYVDDGERNSKPSTIISLIDPDRKIIRS